MRALAFPLATVSSYLIDRSPYLTTTSAILVTIVHLNELQAEAEAGRVAGGVASGAVEEQL